MRHLALLFIAGCGGSVSLADAGSDAEVDVATLDAPVDAPVDAADGLAFGGSCVTDAGAFTCDAGNGWAWGDAEAFCAEPCPLGSSCYTIGAGSQAGTCQ